MRRIILASSCLLTIALTAYLGAGADKGPVSVHLRPVEAETGKSIGGMVRIFAEGQDKPIVLPGLLSRLRGLEKSGQVSGWFVIPAAGAMTQLPPGKYRLEALSGLETRLYRAEFDLRGSGPAEVSLRLSSIFRPEKQDLIAGNTHLHLRNLTMEESDDYLRQIPAADGLKVMFISYLERLKDDASYITNRYPVGDLKQFTATGVLFNNGEEHRHNFQGFGQGYGHVMLLNIQKLVQPVSIGPGIAGAPFDEPSLSVGIDEARRQGGTIIWCHNTNGHEDVVNALAGRLDALNVFDGSRTGKFEDNYYRYLNIGLRMPISTGTDWFMYDFSRVYARVTGPLTIPSWLEAVKAGRCVATNGPLLTLTVDGKSLGETIKLDKPKTVRIEATGIGRHDFQLLELIHTGKVIDTVRTEKGDGSYAARIKKEINLDGPGWLAVRINSTTQNEFEKMLYAHTSPVYVEIGGRRLFDAEAARALLRQLEEGEADIRAKARFSSDESAEKVLALYRQAIRDLTTKVNQ